LLTNDSFGIKVMVNTNETDTRRGQVKSGGFNDGAITDLQ